MQAIKDRKSVSDIVRLVAEQGSALLDAPCLDEEQTRWLRALEEAFGVHIILHTTLGPDNLPAAIDGVIAGDHQPTGFQWAFHINRHETRCCLRALAD